jgi:hypothetical protein
VPLVNNLQVHDYQFEFPLPAGKWRWTTRLDVSGSNPSYSIRDIKSPYGLLRDSIPLPGDVVQAMAESIDDLKANFSPHMLIGPPSSLTFEVDEGRGYSLPQGILLTNDGVYGSILGVSITSSAPYLRSVPGNIGNLAVNETGQFDVDVNSATLLADDSPYSDVLTIQDPGATNSPQTVPITIIVRPKPTVATSIALLIFTVVKPLTGSFPPVPDQTFSVQNSGPLGSVLDFDVNKLTGLSDWLTGILPATGILDSGDNQSISVSVSPADGLSKGTYTETLRIGGFSTNSYVDVEVRLVIT